MEQAQLSLPCIWLEIDLDRRTQTQQPRQWSPHWFQTMHSSCPMHTSCPTANCFIMVSYIKSLVCCTTLSLNHTSVLISKASLGPMLGCCTAQRALQWSLLTKASLRAMAASEHKLLLICNTEIYQNAIIPNISLIAVQDVIMLPAARSTRPCGKNTQHL